MNNKLATILYELSVLYELKGVSFKPRAFERASNALASLSEEVADIYQRDGLEGLEHIPGVGRGIADRIVEFIRTKHVREYDTLKKKLPVDISGIMAIEGIGPKTLRLLYTQLGITTRSKLERLARAGKLAGVRGIGEKGQERIVRAIGYLKQSQGRYSPGLIWTNIRAIADRIESWPHVKELEFVGSLRRMQETIGDLDMLAVSDDTEDTLRRFVSLPQVRSVYEHGEHHALVRLKMGVDADVWVVPAESYGAALIAWTGDKAHNIHLRTIAKKKGYLLDDFGLFKKTHMVAGETERAVYHALGMQTLPPEVRSDTGEIEAALRGDFPTLVGYNDIRGDLQVQTDWSDGQDSILTMAKAARSQGLEYIAVTDHTKSLTIAHGLDGARLRKQWAEIDRIQQQLSDIKILKGTECDIRKDGSLDLPDEILAQLDIVGISVHSHFDLSERDQTRRIIRAMEHPHTHILFHPTGRLINRRADYAVDIRALLNTAKETHTVMEVNAHPSRLDLNDQHIRAAIALGVRLSIDTDAHAIDEFGYLRWGIGQARRGWARKRDIINTRPWRQMLALLK